MIAYLDKEPGRARDTARWAEDRRRFDHITPCPELVCRVRLGRLQHNDHDLAAAGATWRRLGELRGRAA